MHRKGISRITMAVIIAVIIVIAGVIAALLYTISPAQRPTQTVSPPPITPTTPLAIVITTPTLTTPAFTTPVPTTFEKLLRVSFANVPYLDPAVGSDEASTVYLLNVYDTLVYPLPNGSIIPHLASKWDVSPDGLVWTFYLRQGVKFHSGRELTAYDVDFSLKRLITIGEGYAYLLAPYVDLNNTKVIDKYTIQIALKKPYALFLQALVRLYIVDSELVRAHIKKPGPYGEMGDYGKDWLMSGEKDAGSGPYMLVKYVRGESVTLARFKDYWGQVAPNAPDTVVMLGTTEPTTIRTLIARRELEISDQWQPLENYDAMSKIRGVEIAKIPTAYEFYLMIHTRKPPTDDIHVRKALSYVFDYDTAIKDINPYERRACGPVPSTLIGYNKELGCITRNVTLAMEELKKSKYYGQLDKYPIEFWWIAEVPWEERVALLFKQNAEAIGLKVNVVKKPWLSVVEALSKPETSPNIVSIFVASDFLEAGGMLANRYHSKVAGTWQQNEWLLNSTIDRMIEDAVSTLDLQSRLEKYYEIQKIIFEMYPSIYLYEHTILRAYQAYYVDFPAARGNVAPLLGYDLEFRWIQVYPEKRQELLRAGG
ncbi:MAG: ABC transporter substrate-binding protein [Desulfurococcales archaeon]|jgi:peptide/nickel transport system substrate-binding protein|nr:ABC transporter substrate-binding protein [Desulfurococcales archaeon]